MTRWSEDSDSGSISRVLNFSPFQTGFIADFDTPRIATSGALTIGVNDVPPMPPSELIEKQPPLICAGPSLPSRAFFASSELSRAISITPFWSQSRRSEEHTSELQSLMRISYAVFCLKKNNTFD